MVPTRPQSTKGSREINTSLPLSLFLSSPNSPLIFLRLLRICISARLPVPALYLPPLSPFLCAVPPLPQPVRFWSENKQTFAFILPLTLKHVCQWLRMRSTERWGARWWLIVCGAIWGRAGHRYRQRKVMDRPRQRGRDAVGTVGVGQGGRRRRRPFEIQGRQQGGYAINGGIDTRDEFLTLQQSTRQASSTNSFSLSLSCFLSLSLSNHWVSSQSIRSLYSEDKLGCPSAKV